MLIVLRRKAVERKVNDMEEQKQLANWSEVKEKGDTRFFSPQYDQAYKVTISSVELVKKAFKAGDEPKLKACCILKTINGDPSGKIWETGSFSIMRELKKHIKDEKWCGANVTYLLKKKKEGDKTTYVFEELSVEAYV